MSLLLDAHRQYLSDSARLDAFGRAIAEVVRAGDVVVDLGSGTGVLGVLACRAGAAKVYSLELTSMIGVARQIGRANDLADRVVFLRAHSSRVELPEKAQVVVTDQIGRFGFEAGAFEYCLDARRRFLAPGGVTIPCGIDLVIGLVESAEMWARVAFWDSGPAGVDVGPGRAIARNTGYPVAFAPEELLAAPALLASLDPGAPGAGVIRGVVGVDVERPGTLHGVGGWFSARLSPGVVMSNSPCSSERINRRNVFFPVDRPVEVGVGDRVEVDMRVVTADVMVQWKVTVSAPDGTVKASSRHSTFEGMLLSREDLARTRPDFRPALTERGMARMAVLQLCDGRRPLEEIEAELKRRYPALFPRFEDAALFVAEVVTRYAT